MPAVSTITKKNPAPMRLAAGAEKPSSWIGPYAFSNQQEACKPSFSEITNRSTGSCPADWREFWRLEPARAGSDWRSLVRLHFQIGDQLRAS